MTALQKITVLCPVYNEEITVPLFFERISKVFEQLKGRYEPNLVFLDNCSQDRTPEIVKDLCAKNPGVYSIVLSRNFGYQCSVECGLRNSKGDFFVVIDVDCEDPPELILEFLKVQETGYDIVYGERVDREEGRLIKAGRKLYYRFTRKVADEHFILDMAEFCLISNEVREAILQDNNSYPFIRASVGRIGYKRIGIPFKRHKRIAGETHYNFWRMSVFAVAGILSSSTLFLRLPIYIFPFWILAMLGLTVGQIVAPNGWLLPVQLWLGFGFSGYTTVFISLYLARVYKNGMNRPNFIVNRKRSLLQPELQSGPG